MSEFHLFSGWSFPESALQPLRDELGRRLNAAPIGLIGGWSLGGLHALQLAAQGKAARVVLISSTARFCSAETDWPGLSRANLRALQRQLTRAPAEALAGFHRLCAGAGVDDSVITKRTADSLSLGLDFLTTGLRELDQLDLRAELGRCTQPILILHGAQDQVIPVQAAEQTAQRLPHAKLVVHPQAGHDLPLAHPAWVAEHMASFINHPA